MRPNRRTISAYPCLAVVFFLFFLFCLACLLASAAALAQGAPSGFELALHGPREVLADRTACFRGVAYAVYGLAELKPLARARVRARVRGSHADDGEKSAARGWRMVAADERGSFRIDVQMPENGEGTPKLEIGIGDGQGERIFTFPLELGRPWVIDLVTDRLLYEPGETIHVWARLRDLRSLRPLAGRAIRFSLPDTIAAGEKTASTDASGVAALAVPIPREAAEGGYRVQARIDDAETESERFRIGTRIQQRLFAEASLTPAIVEPHELVAVSVKVTAASGTVVRGATVAIEIDGGEAATAVTDSQGIAKASVRAPAYLEHQTGVVSVRVEAKHPGYGSTSAHAALGLRVPLKLDIEAVAPNAGLVPELDSQLFIRVSKGDDTPPPVGTPLEVRGASIRGGIQRTTTDRNGLAVVPTRLPRVGGASAMRSSEQASDAAGEESDWQYEDGDEDGETNGWGTTVTIEVAGDAPRAVRLEIPVRPGVEVVPRVARPVVTPGDAIEIALARRGRAIRLPVVVELQSDTELLEVRVVNAGEQRVAMRAPVDRVGILQVRARPLVQGGAEEGTGGYDALLLRPAQPSFPELHADRDTFSVRSVAKLRLSTRPGAPRSWAAVLVRDLAAHGGETPFAREFLEEQVEQQLDQAVVDPAAASSDLFLRTALAAYVWKETMPRLANETVDVLGRPLPARDGLEVSEDRGVWRDPFPLADELRRRGLRDLLRSVEELLDNALDEGRLADVVAGTGQASRFRPDILAEPEILALIEPAPVTLGNGSLTLAMLEAADPSFSFEHVARRIARKRLVQLAVALARFLDPGDEASPQERILAREPHDRWLALMIERGTIRAEQLADPWGGTFAIRPSRAPVLVVAVEAANLELVSPGPDNRLGTGDDVRDPFARAVPAGTPYAVASGEDELMDRLSCLSPGKDVLGRLLTAYSRVETAISEEEIGDAVDAEVYGGLIGNEVGEMHGGFGTIGRGHGAGSGIGSARLRTSGGTAGGIVGLASFVRERFPATLLFASSLPVDPSGWTKIEIPLADAVTTYLVEVIVWGSDGWTWWTSTKIRVDKGTVVDAPIPRYAISGDVLRIPVRINNRTASDQTVSVTLAATGAYAQPEPLEAPRNMAAGEPPSSLPMVQAKESTSLDGRVLGTSRPLRIPANDAVEVTIPITPTEVGDSHVVLSTYAQDGALLDAARWPMTTYAPTRRARLSHDFLVRGAGSTVFEIPGEASPRGGGEIALRVGSGVFAVPERSEWVAGAEELFAAWAESWTAKPGISPELMHTLDEDSGSTRTKALAAVWAVPAVPDRPISDALQEVARDSARRGASREDLFEKAKTLLYLAPAVLHIRERSTLAPDLTATLRQLRAGLEASVVEATDAPHLWALAAAALAWTAPPGASLERVAELVRRVRRYEVQIGIDSLILSPGEWPSSEIHYEATALLGLAEIKLGDYDRAFERLSTLGRLEIDHGALDPNARTVARVAAVAGAVGPPPESALVMVDGSRFRVPLTGGVGRLTLPALASPGRHQVSVELPARHRLAVHLRGTVEFGLPWHVAPASTGLRPGSIRAAVEGEPRSRDEHAGLALVVRNRSPRTIGRPVVEIGLPAGAELDEAARAIIRWHTAVEPDATRGTLRLELHALPPGGIREIPLPIRWTVAGQLQGLGIASFPSDNPEDVSVTPPRTWDIGEPEVAVQPQPEVQR
ncbi:MAG: MG2 domain-containing protein [Pseudomonadota bacterium]